MTDTETVRSLCVTVYYMHLDCTSNFRKMILKTFLMINLALNLDEGRLWRQSVVTHDHRELEAIIVDKRQVSVRC